MRQPVGVVRVLVGVVEARRVVAGQLAGPADRPVGALVGVGPVHDGAVGAQDSLAFRGDAGGHGQMHRESQRRSQHGEGDAGISAGRVEQGLAGSEQAARAGIADHRRRGAILHAAAGIGPLRLGQQGNAFEPADGLVQTDQRRVPDAFGQGGTEAGLCGGRRHGKMRRTPNSREPGYARLGMRDYAPASSILADWIRSMARKSHTPSFEQMLDALRAHSFDVKPFPGVADGVMVTQGWRGGGPDSGQGRRAHRKRHSGEWR